MDTFLAARKNCGNAERVAIKFRGTALQATLLL